MTTSIAVFPATRHVRLQKAHAALLFGDKALVELHRLADGTVASDGVVDVDGPVGRVAGLRVLLPYVDKDAVYVDGVDVVAAGFSFSVPHSPGTPGCTVRGPVGVLVIGSGVWPAERVVLPQAEKLRLDVHLDGERLRHLRGVAVEIKAGIGDDDSAAYANDIGDLRPGTRATVG